MELPLVNFASEVPIWDWSEDDVDRCEPKQASIRIDAFPRKRKLGNEHHVGSNRVIGPSQQEPWEESTCLPQVDQDSGQWSLQIPRIATTDHWSSITEAVLQGSRRALRNELALCSRAR